MTRLTRSQARPTGERGQSLVELALVVPVILLLLLGMLEFGLVFDHTLTVQYASREGARVGSAMANGGGVLGCATGQSPNASTVDPLIVAAVSRVLNSPGSRVAVSEVASIRIFKADSSGNEVGSYVNVWTYAAGGGPTVDGRPLDFALSSTGWPACSRSNAYPPDSIGVSLAYTYRMQTPLGALLDGFFGGSGWPAITVSDRTVMALNPTN